MPDRAKYEPHPEPHARERLVKAAVGGHNQGGRRASLRRCVDSGAVEAWRLHLIE